MKKINMKILIITSVVCLLPILLGLGCYKELPENIAIHFDINNNPNNYFPKPVFIFVMPLIMLVLQLICCISTDLADKNTEANKKVTTIFKWIIPTLSIVMYVITIMYALGNSIDIRKVVMCILGVLFIVMGNYLPKTVGNAKFPGIKNEDLKKKLLRISAYFLILDGFLAIFSILFKPLISILIIAIVLLEIILLYIYAFIKNRRL